jgi:hypothetical protein
MKKIGAGLIFLATACGGGAAQEPAKTPVNAENKPVPSTSAPGPEAKPNVWALPEGPRDAASAKPETAPVPPLKLDGWKAASKVKGVPAPPATCAKAKDAKADADFVQAAMAAPPECADAIVDPALAKHGDATDEAGHKLVALSLAGKLARTAAVAPAMKDASDKEKVKKFIQGPLRAWMVEQATAIDTLSSAGTQLAPAARAIVAVEAGMADLRLVDRIRSAPTPSTWDKELKAVYEAALDEALEPRKKRGRDAALVGLSDYAQARAANEPRVERARALLSKLYGGRRIDALDTLAVPNAPPRFELGRKYWRRVDFVEAAYVANERKDDDARLTVATSLALAKGPDGAKEMMLAPSPGALGLDHTDALDALSAEGGKNAGLAAFNAAYLRSLCVPEGEKASAYLADVAARARKAESLLTDADLKKKASALASDSEAAAKATH